ncbi:hypothetical protein [Nocardiopsis gilva]|uniref:hypothetical protein n=1 Tax=Nocardiopsis gilva TaxID=280236 RepID=UPI00036F85B8|nr:hypothetical protein [Nocardiopsis gilva]
MGHTDEHGGRVADDFLGSGTRRNTDHRPDEHHQATDQGQGSPAQPQQRERQQEEQPVVVQDHGHAAEGRQPVPDHDQHHRAHDDLDADPPPVLGAGDHLTQPRDERQ